MISNVSPVQFIPGTDTSGPYAVNFQYLDASHLSAFLVDAVGAVTAETGFTLDGDEVTFTGSIATGETVVLMRTTPILQPAEFPNNARFDPDEHESEMDRLCMIAQELWELSQRCIRLQVVESDAFDNSVEFASPDLADAGVQIDSGGDGFDYFEDVLPITSAAANAILAAASASTAATASASAVADVATIAPLEADINDLDYMIGTHIVRTSDTTYTVTGGGVVVAMDPSTHTATTITLPSSPEYGAHVTLKNASMYMKDIDIAPAAGDTIDGLSGISLAWPQHAVGLSYDGTSDWSVISEQDYGAYEHWPRLVWTSTKTVGVTARGYVDDFASGCNNDRISMVFANDRVYHNDGSLEIDIDTEGVGGIESTPVAVDRFYYVYLVQSPWRGLSAIASLTAPPTGPSGYSDWRYVGSFRTHENVHDNYGYVSVVEFVQAGSKFMLVRPGVDSHVILNIQGKSPTLNAWFANDHATYTESGYRYNILTDYIVPETFGCILVNSTVQCATEAAVRLMLSPSVPATSVYDVFRDGRGPAVQTGSANRYQVIGRNGSDGKLYWVRSRTGGLMTIATAVVGWEDAEVKAT